MSAHELPASTLDAVHGAPPDAVTVLLLRHAARGPIPDGDPGNDVPLLPAGVVQAHALGRVIGDRLGVLRSSPVPRCVQTAAALAEGAGRVEAVVPDTHLGDPGVYVEEGGIAWKTWQAIGHECVVEHLVAGERLPGLADPIEASRRLVTHALEIAGGVPGVHVLVTHDLLVTTAAAHCLGRRLIPADWPRFLEALVLVERDGVVVARYRGWSGRVATRAGRLDEHGCSGEAPARGFSSGATEA